MSQIQDWFVKHEDEYLKYEDILPERRLHNRDDINAFLLLDKLVPGKLDMVASACHDEFYLDISPEDLEGVATEEDILDLIRCGVLYEGDSLKMFT